MALRINYNLASSSAQRGLGASQEAYAKQATRLSTGLRINSASDDAAGMAVSEKLKNQVRGLNQAQRNAQDGISLIQTAEGALTETHSLLARMRELAVQSSNDTLSASDRANLQVEFTALYAEVDRISSTTAFNGIYLLNNADVATGMTLQIGANNGNTFTLTVGGAQMSTLNSNFDSAAATLTTVGYQSSASAVISAVDAAVNAVSTARAGLGALQNRLESVGRSLAVASENTAAANSRVADADIAASMSELVRAQILQQAGISVLAQANQAPSLVLQLLR
ncbi:MAG: flagellin FliC [Proteobacteria bacterium]|jgi:flagellin|nr:flagellin FliC [Pseudomonadota bacterium]NDE08121.1 flagellin FliC [Chloroflexota bacterium]